MEIELNLVEMGRLEDVLGSVINRVLFIFKGNFNNINNFICVYLIFKILVYNLEYFKLYNDNFYV